MVTKVLVSKSIPSSEPAILAVTDDEKLLAGMLATVAETQRTVMSEMIAAKKIFFITLYFRVLLICFHSIMSQLRKGNQIVQSNQIYLDNFSPHLPILSYVTFLHSQSVNRPHFLYRKLNIKYAGTCERDRGILLSIFLKLYT